MARTPAQMDAWITAADTRLAKAEARLDRLEKVPPPPPPPPPQTTESPDGATITKEGEQLVIKGTRWGLKDSGPTVRGMQVVRNDQVLTETGFVDLGLRSKDQFHQRNTSKNWYAASDPGGAWTDKNWSQEAGDPRAPAPPTPTPTSSIPKQALDAGFKTPVLMSDFTTAKEVADWGAAGPADWYTGGPNGRWTNLGDLTLNNSVLALNTSRVNFSANISTVRGNNAAISTPGQIVPANDDGRMYHRGYFEAKMRFNKNRGGGPGWPSFWGTCLDVSPQDHLEIDFMESQNGSDYNNGFLNWFNGKGSAGAFGEFFGALGADGYPDWNAAIQNAGLDTQGGWNVFGCLWTEDELSFWWNSWAGRQAGKPDTCVARYPTKTPFHGFISNDFNRGGNMTLAGAENPTFYLILGSSTGSGTEFDWVHVYQ